MSTATIEEPDIDTAATTADEGNPQSWRSLSIIELDLPADGATFKALVAARLDTLGEVADLLKTNEEKCVLRLDAFDTNALVDMINLAAELDTEFDELLPVETVEENDEEDDDEGDESGLPVFDPTTPEGRIDYDRQTIELVNRAEQTCERLESEWADLKSEASEAKKQFEKSRNRLRKLISNREFNRTVKPTPKQPTVFDKPVECPEAPPANPATAELWKEYPLTFERWERFGLTSKDVERLNGGIVKGNNPAHPITTFGDVARFIAPNPNNPGYSRTLADLKGFGETGVNRFQEAEVAFWKWWHNGGEQEYAAEVGVKPVKLPSFMVVHG